MPGKTYILVSVFLHAIALAIVLVGVPGGTPRQLGVDEEPAVCELVVTDTPPSVPTPMEPPPESRTEADAKEAPRIEYAGSPPEASQPRTELRAPKKREAAPTDAAVAAHQPRPTDARPAPEQHIQPIRQDLGLAAADAVRLDGVRIPAFDVTLDGNRMSDILRSGQGLLVAIVAEDAYVLNGRLDNLRAVRAASADDLGRFSQRALAVPATSAKVQESLRWDFGVPADLAAKSKLRLLLANAIDHLILARQKQAATSAGVQIESIGSVRGRLVFTNGQISDFEGQQVVLRNGRVVPIGTAAKTGTGQEP